LPPVMVADRLLPQLDDTVRFIRSVKDETGPMGDEQADVDDDATTMVRRPESGDFAPLEPGVPPERLAAVDGGSAVVLDGGSFVIAAYRAEALDVSQGKIAGPPFPPSPTVTPVSHLNRDAVYCKKYRDLLGCDPESCPHDINLVVERLRNLDEWQQIHNAGQRMQKGDVILVDGSLRAGIKRTDRVLEEVLGNVAERGVSLVGVSKRSVLRFRNSPALPVIKSMGDDLFPGSGWFCRLDIQGDRSHSLGDLYVAKLHPASRFVFRLDVASSDQAREVLSQLLPLSRDPQYLGYPHPLAAVHNRVSISKPEAEDIRHFLRQKALQGGVPPSWWDDTFANFHNVLDRGV